MHFLVPDLVRGQVRGVRLRIVELAELFLDSDSQLVIADERSRYKTMLIERPI